MKIRASLLSVLLALCACGPLRAQTGLPTGRCAGCDLGDASPAHRGTVDLLAQVPPLVDLSKVYWRFHPGDDPRWADPAFDDSQWPLLAGNRTWDVQGYKGLGGYAWYRIHIKLPPNLRADFAPGHVFDNFQVFADGRQIAQWGSLSANAIPLYGQSPWSLVVPIPPHFGELVIAIRVWHWPGWAPFKTGGFGAVAKFFGDPVALGRQFDLAKSADLVAFSPHLILTVISLLGGLLSLLLYAKQRSRSEYLWFGLFLLCQGLEFSWIFSVRHWIPQRLDVRDAIGSMFADLAQFAAILFFFRFIGSPVTRWIRWFLAVQVCFIVWDPLFGTFGNFAKEQLIVTLDVALSYLVVLWLVFTHWRRSSAARRLAIPLILVSVADVVSLVYDNLYFAGVSVHTLPQVIASPFLLQYQDLARYIFLAAMAYVLIERFAETQAERSRLESEFEAARTVQHVLIPDFLPPVVGLAVESAYLPAQEVGGDFFQVLPLEDGAAFIVVGDVSGKGLKAAMTVSLIVGTLRTLAEYIASPAEVLAGLNRRLHGRDAGFATCLVLKVTPDGGMTIANAGHPNPYLDGVEVPTESDLPLGLTLDVVYAETLLHLGPEQTLTLLTDGVIESTASSTRELFGFDRTQAISGQAASAIAEAARAFGRGAPQADDITVLTVRRAPVLEPIPA